MNATKAPTTQAPAAPQTVLTCRRRIPDSGLHQSRPGRSVCRGMPGARRGFRLSPWRRGGLVVLSRVVLFAVFAGCLVLCFSREGGAAEILPRQVVVLANSNDNDSVALARHYLAARGIPDKNLVKLPLPDSEEISWNVFSENIWNPLLEHFVREGWMRGEVSEKPDPDGRRRINCVENRIRYLVLCKGVPLRINGENTLFEREAGEDSSAVRSRKKTASVDSELALLAQFEAPVMGFFPNPVFQQKVFFSEIRAMFIVPARLDGPTFADCRRMVDDAVAAEKIGLAGRAYVDTGGPYAEGDKWLNATADLFEKAGFDLSRETTRDIFQPGCRADSPALYFGWYTKHATGAFGQPSMRFEPGSIAVHIHSYSAATLRSASRHWCGPLIARGATLTFGNVAEPFLNLSTRPDVFAEALLRGEQAGEAYAAATPVWSWQTVLLGDPLYSPFKISLNEQLRLLQKGPRSAFRDNWRDGVFLRQAGMLLAEEKRQTTPPPPPETTTVKLKSPSEIPSATKPVKASQKLLAAAVDEYSTPALRLALARASSRPSLAWSNSDAVAGADLGLLLETARYLWREGNSLDAFPAYTAILARRELSAPLRREILREAAQAAQDAGLRETARKWREEN